MRRLRADAGLSQEMLAELRGLHRTYIGSVERCERNVLVDNIERIAMALQVDVSDLLAPTK
jgi:transcriptional regulator with XRE-family HTH domain